MGPVGAIIMSAFAFVFCGFGIDQNASWFDARLALPLLVTGIIIVQASRVIAKHGGGASSNDPRVGKIIMWSSAAEGVAIFVLINVFNNVGLEARITPGMAAIVGLHFLPMAYAIPFRPFYVIGGAVLTIALIGFLAPPSLGWMIAGIGAALALWIASVLALRRPARLA